MLILAQSWTYLPEGERDVVLNGILVLPTPGDERRWEDLVHTVATLTHLDEEGVDALDSYVDGQIRDPEGHLQVLKETHRQERDTLLRSMVDLAVLR